VRNRGAGESQVTGKYKKNKTKLFRKIEMIQAVLRNWKVLMVPACSKNTAVCSRVRFLFLPSV